MHSIPAPDNARWPRWTRCQSVAAPSSAEYWHIGETTIRLGSATPRSDKGWNRALMGLGTSSGVVLRPDAALLRIVEREAHDGRRQALLQPVQLADLDRRARARRGRRRAGPAPCSSCSIGRARGAGDLADPGAADEDRVALADGLVAGELEADQPRPAGAPCAGPVPPCRSSPRPSAATAKPMPASNGSVVLSNS